MILREKIDRILFYARLIKAEHPVGTKWGSGKLARAQKFVLRALLSWSATTRWLEFIDSQPLALVTNDEKRELAEKIHRPFARLNSTIAGRVDLLIDHYNILGTALRPEVLVPLVSGNPVTLARLTGNSQDERYRITLCRNRLFQQQGELAIALHDDAVKAPLATLATNLKIDRDGKSVLFLSGLQGPSAPVGKAEIVAATRDLYGLRPKRAVMEVAYALADWLDIDKIVAATRVNHVSAIKGKRWRDIRADYDGFWEEFGAVRQPDGDYLLPISLPRRASEHIPQKRRKDALKRYARLDALALDVTRSLTALGKVNSDMAPTARVSQKSLAPLGLDTWPPPPSDSHH